MMMFAALSALVVLSATTSTTHALPNGAQSCPFGQAAPQGFHSSGTELSTSLEDGGFTVALDGALVVGETRMLTLSGGDTVFRGFLVRLEGDGELEPIGTESQIAIACGATPGVTHTGREDKSMIQLFVTPLSAGEMLLDVSVVEFNNGVDGNVYSYAQIAATATEAAAAETEAPVAMAVPPTDAPAMAMVVPATEAPVMAMVPDTEAPVMAMVPDTEAPVAMVVPEVTEAPAAVMVVAPNVTTMVEPNVTDAPVVTTTDAPTVTPAGTDMPVVPDDMATTPKEPEVDYNESGASFLSVGLVATTTVLSMTTLFW